MDGAGGASREGNAHSDDSSRGAGGGAGNLGGSSWAVRGTSYNGSNGTGGLLIIYASEFKNRNLITANGSAGGDGWRAGGGASGGGSINIFYNKNTSSSTSSIIAKGGNASNGLRGSGESAGGGAGGNGTVTKGSISTGEFKVE